MSTQKNLTVMLIKYPHPGTVKTRLAADTSDEFAARSYKNFVESSIQMLEKSEHNYTISISDKSDLDRCKSWLGEKSFHIQTGQNLGERLQNICKDHFETGSHHLVIIGSDTPDLPTRLINASHKALQEHDMVIGPSYDGGYYLIGFKHNIYLPDIFKNIHWSTETVFDKTMSNAKSLGWSVHILEKWNDVDTLEDLNKLQTYML